jgi:hypothetical protein
MSVDLVDPVQSDGEVLVVAGVAAGTEALVGAEEAGADEEAQVDEEVRADGAVAAAEGTEADDCPMC